MLEPRIKAELEREEVSPFHEKLLTHCRDLVKLSRNSMKRHYDEWDRHDEVYRGCRTQDKEDKLAENRGDPAKAVIPVTKAQVDTFVAFAFSLLFQNDKFFGLTPFGSDNHKAAAAGESLLQRDLDYSNIHRTVWQFFLNFSRFGLGVMKNNWVEEFQMVEETAPPTSTQNIAGQEVEMLAEGGSATREVKQLKYQGNKLQNVSPYRFFPDPRYPISDFQRGEFVATEDEYSTVELRTLEADGVIAGVKYIKEMTQGDMEFRPGARDNFVQIHDNESETPRGNNGATVISEVIVKLVPADFILDDGKPMGESTRPEKWIVWYANSKRIVRAEKYKSPVDTFPHFVGELTPDEHHFINQGIAGSLDQIQEIISWFINSHITSVRKVIANRLVVDTSNIEMKDITARSPVIRLRNGAGRRGIDNYIKQLEVSDVTATHVKDASTLHEMAQITTGINDNALGQFNSGRRSAQEARNVNSSVAARLKTIVSVAFQSAFAPAGEHMLANLRAGLSLDVWVKLFGVAEDPTKYFDFAKISNSELIGDYDFEVFDATLPSERNHQAQTLQELLVPLLGSPELVVATQIDVKELFFEILRLKGIRHPRRFQMGFDDMVQMQKMMAFTEGAANGQTGGQVPGGAGPLGGGVGPQPGNPTLPQAAGGVRR